MKPPKIVDKPISLLSRKLIRYAEILAEGRLSMIQAAELAGYSPKVADKQAYRWIGRSREISQYPQLWDYFEKLRKEKLRQYDVNVESIVNELRTVAFSSIDFFIDMPSIEDGKREALINDISDAYTRQFLGGFDNGEGMTARDKKLIRDWPEQKFLELKALAQYRPGKAIKLKSIEEIPKSLIPAISEIHETKEGIRVKLHSKLDALEKLGRWLKMFAADKPDEGKPIDSVHVDITVNGTRSTLLGTISGPEEKAA